jgi:hypothetical protein
MTRVSVYIHHWLSSEPKWKPSYGYTRLTEPLQVKIKKISQSFDYSLLRSPWFPRDFSLSVRVM